VARAYILVEYLAGGFALPEPIDHTLVLLREIRGAVAELESKVDRNHEDLTKRIETLRRAWYGESVLGRYAAAEVEGRLAEIENRLTALEQSE
jgi:hypothetical protein